MSKRIRVLQLTHDLTLGGLEQVIVTLCRTIDKDRFDVSVLCLWELGPFAEQLLDEGFEVQLLPGNYGQGERGAFLKVANVLREKRVDVLHTHNTPAFLSGAPAAFLARTPTAVHTDHARNFPDKFRYMLAEHVASHLVYRVVGVSEHTTRNLHHYERIPRRKLTTIQNGIEGSRFQLAMDRDAKRRELGLPPTGPILGVAARLIEQKDLPTLLNALTVVVEDVPDVNLVIAGEGPMEPELRKLTAELGLTKRVHFLGPRFDIPELLALFDVYVNPSIWEGLPMVILEAMAAGCPIVATRVGGVPKAITDGVNGTLVPASDPEVLGRALTEMIRNSALRMRYAQAGRQIFAERFSAQIMARKYEALYMRREFGNGHPAS